MQLVGVLRVVSRGAESERGAPAANALAMSELEEKRTTIVKKYSSLKCSARAGVVAAAASTSATSRISSGLGELRQRLTAQGSFSEHLQSEVKRPPCARSIPHPHSSSFISTPPRTILRITKQTSMYHNADHVSQQPINLRSCSLQAPHCRNHRRDPHSSSSVYSISRIHSHRNSQLAHSCSPPAVCYSSRVIRQH